MVVLADVCTAYDAMAKRVPLGRVCPVDNVRSEDVKRIFVTKHKMSNKNWKGSKLNTYSCQEVTVFGTPS